MGGMAFTTTALATIWALETGYHLRFHQVERCYVNAGWSSVSRVALNLNLAVVLLSSAPTLCSAVKENVVWIASRTPTNTPIYLLVISSRVSEPFWTWVIGSYQHAPTMRCASHHMAPLHRDATNKWYFFPPEVNTHAIMSWPSLWGQVPQRWDDW